MKTIALNGTSIADLLIRFEVVDSAFQDFCFPSSVWAFLSKLQKKPLTIYEIADFFQTDVRVAKALLKQLIKEGVCTPMKENFTFQEWLETTAPINPTTVFADNAEPPELEFTIPQNEGNTPVFTNPNTYQSELLDVYLETEEEVISVTLS